MSRVRELASIPNRKNIHPRPSNPPEDPELLGGGIQYSSLVQYTPTPLAGYRIPLVDIFRGDPYEMHTVSLWFAPAREEAMRKRLSVAARQLVVIWSSAYPHSR